VGTARHDFAHAAKPRDAVPTLRRWDTPGAIEEAAGNKGRLEHPVLSLHTFILTGALIGAFAGAVLGFRSWSGYRGYYFGQYWSAAIITTMLAGGLLGFVVGAIFRAAFSY
jgi:hypothetical protein